MELHSLKYNYKSRGHKTKTYGRGKGSGIGGTSTKGSNGQNARKSGGTRLGFEGGQTPIYRRLPKIGFKNPMSKKYETITLRQINLVPVDVINLDTLKKFRFIKKSTTSFKIIGNDKVERKLSVVVNMISKQAKEAIEAAGGSVELVQTNAK